MRGAGRAKLKYQTRSGLLRFDHEGRASDRTSWGLLMDTLSKFERSARMSLVRSTNTRPELALRRLVYASGFRYRLHAKSVMGRPDIVNGSKRVAIFLHGCFWHRHDCPSGHRTPKSRVKFWSDKFARNIRRDRQVRNSLRGDGWRTLVVWECELRAPEKITARLSRFLNA